MEPVNPVLPGEGRWLTGDASARASEVIRTLPTTFQLSQKLFLGLEDCMLSFWSLCFRSLMYSSSVEELVLLKEDHKKDINSTVVRPPIFVLDSKTVAEADVVAESVEDTFPSFKCMVPCSGLWRDGNLETHTQWQGMAFKKYTCEIKRARGESMTSWINRSDEALMDMRKKLATALGDKDSGNPRKQAFFLQLKRFQRTMTTPISMTISAKNDDPYVDEDGNFLANEQIVSDIDEDLALDDEEYHEALFGYREARDLMKEARGCCPVVVPTRSDKPTGKGKGEE